MQNTSYNNRSDVLDETGIAAADISADMGRNIVDRAAQVMNKELNGETSTSGGGIVYLDFQNVSSDESTYVDDQTYEVIQRMHLYLSSSYAFDFATLPEHKEFQRVNGRVVEYRQDFLDKAKAKEYLNKYNRLKSMLAESDSGDNYFASMRKSSSSAGMVKINARAEPYYMRDTPR